MSCCMNAGLSGNMVPDKEYRSAKPDILYRKTENKGTVLHEEHIFRGRLSKLLQVFEEFFLVYEIEM